MNFLNTLKAIHGVNQMKFMLSGNIDDDHSIAKLMHEGYWDILMDCHHQGQCDKDVKYALDFIDVEDLKAAREYIIDCGVESEALKDIESIKMYYLWILAGDIQERNLDNE